MAADVADRVTSCLAKATIMVETGAFFHKYKKETSPSRCRDQATRMVKEIRKVLGGKEKNPEKDVLGPIIFAKVQAIVSMTSKA